MFAMSDKIWNVPVKVTPNAKKQSLDVVHDMLGFVHLHIKVGVPPEENKANIAVIERLKEFFGLPQKTLLILKGHKNCHKVIRIMASESDIFLCQNKIKI